jgi:5-amino-6-(5-phosphoribosylamino)uracil reductase
VTLRELLPERRNLTPEEATTGLGLSERAPDDRPYLAVNMVSTADGKITMQGRAGPLSNPTDQAILYGLRTQGDAIMVGAGTARVERYGNLLPDPALRERRQAAGLDPEPLVVIVSASLRIPPDLPLLQEESARVLVITASGGELPPVPARVEYLRGDAVGRELPLAPLMATLRREQGVRSVVCEGGGHLNSTLFHEALADELWLAVAPLLAGGEDALTAVSGPPLDPPARLELLRVLEEDAYVYNRYSVRR